MPRPPQRRLRRLLGAAALLAPLIVAHRALAAGVVASTQPSQVIVTYQVVASRAPRMCVGTDAKFEVEVDRLVVTPSTPEFRTSLAPADVIAFYEQQLGAPGWVPDGEPMNSATGTLRTFVRGGESIAVVARTRDGDTRVTLTQYRGVVDQSG